MRWIPVLLIAALLSSCSASKDNAEKEPETPQITPDATSTEDSPLMKDLSGGDPTNVIVSVDGETLTLGDLRMEVGLRLSSIQGAPNTPEVMNQMQQIVIDQFITRTLILNEAKKQGLSVSDEDLKKEFDSIQKMLPPDVALDDMIDQSPLGRDAMIDHIKNKILVEKVTKGLADDKVEVSKEEVDEFIEQNKDQLTVPETVEARHILLLFEEGDDDKAKAEKKTKLEGIRKEILDGAEFEEMAKKHSECGSAQDGGYLGKFDETKMVPAFSKAAFSQKVGEVGEIVESPFGYHIIKVEGHDEEGMYPREDIEARIKDIKMQTAMQDLIEDLREKADIKRFSDQ